MVHVVLSGNVDTDMFEALVQKTCRIKQQDITIHLCTEGGDVYVGLAMFDYIRSLPSMVTVISSGCVMSAGMFILQAADKRFTRPHCYFLVHYGFDTQRSRSERKHNVDLDKLHEEIMLLRCKGLGPKTITKWLNQEIYLNVDEALKYGLIDKVLE